MNEAKGEPGETQRLRLADSTNSWVEEYFYFYLTGDKASMAQSVAKVAGREDEFRFTFNVAFVDEFSGRYREAEKDWKQAAEEANLQKAPMLRPVLC